MKEPPKHKLIDTLGTVSIPARKMIESAIDGCVHYFDEKHEVPPALLALPEFGMPKVFLAAHRNGAEKQIVWSFLRFLKETHPVVVLISEAWYSHHEGKNVDVKKIPPPSQDPNRKEMLMVNVWDGDRNILISAEITRHPNRLGEFFVRNDTLFPDKFGKFTGTLHQGDSYKKQSN